MIVYKLKYNMAFQKLGDEYICVAPVLNDLGMETLFCVVR